MPVSEVIHGWDAEKLKLDHPQFVYELEEIYFHHSYSCPHYEEYDGVIHDDCISECRVEVRGRETAYTGAVLREWEKNGYSDSDWFVTVYDVVEQKVKSYEYSTTRAACYGNWARADATPEIIAQAIESMMPIIEAGWHKENARQVKDVMIGREVKVLGGRKYKDKVGVVRWIGKSPYHYTKYDDRVRIETADGESFFMDLDRVEVIDPERYLKGQAELENALAVSRSNMIYAWGRPAAPTVMVMMAPLETEVSF